LGDAGRGLFAVEKETRERKPEPPRDGGLWNGPTIAQWIETAAVVPVMRKLLHSIYGMLKHGQDFDGKKIYAGMPSAP